MNYLLLNFRLLSFLLVALAFSGFSQTKRTDSLQNILKTSSNDSIRSKAAFQIGVSFFEQQQPFEAQRYLTDAFKYARKAKSYTLMRKALLSLSDNLFMSEQFEFGIQVGNMSKALFILHNDSSAIKQTCLRLGVNYASTSLFNEATKQYFNALTICENQHDTIGMSFIYNNLGLTYADAGNREKAMEFLTKSIVLKKSIGDSMSIAKSYGNLLNISMEFNLYANVLKYGYTARSYLVGHDTNEIHATVYLNLSTVYAFFIKLNPDSIKKLLPYTIPDIKIKQVLLDSCIYYSDRAMIYCNKYNDDYTMAYAYNANGQAFFYYNNPGKAISYFEKSSAIFKKYSAKKDLLGAISYLSEAYRDLNDYKKSYDMLTMATGLKDSIFNQSKQKEFAQLETKYQYEQKLADEQKEKKKQLEIANTQKLTQRIIIASISAILLIIILFSYSLLKRFRITKQQKTIIEEKNKAITDSIHYANRIQKALLANNDLLQKNLGEHFVLYQPKDIVSGDFYWAYLYRSKFYLAIADCTGHGVPGAFMSLINISFLNEALSEKGIEQPNEILNHSRNRIIESLKGDGSEEGGKDGMDCALLSLNYKDLVLEYACANNPIIIIRDNMIIESTSDRMPVGRSPKENESFTLQRIQLKKGDMIYAFTDGYIDQFGGPKGKKYKYKSFIQQLLLIHRLPLQQQHDALRSEFLNWKGNMEQIDDVLITGIKI